MSNGHISNAGQAVQAERTLREKAEKQNIRLRKLCFEMLALLQRYKLSHNAMFAPNPCTCAGCVKFENLCNEVRELEL